MTKMLTKGLKATAVAGVAVAALLAVPAQAITLTPGIIQGFTQVDQSNVVAHTDTTALTTYGATFSTVFAGGGSFLDGVQWANIGSTGLNIDYAANETLKVVVNNDNENPWSFELFVDGVGAGAVSIVNGSSAILSYALGGAAGTLHSVWVQVSGDLPLGNDPQHPDRTAEYQIAAVPVPPALLLIGSGLLGLGVFGRRKKVNKDALSAA